MFEIACAVLLSLSDGQCASCAAPQRAVRAGAVTVRAVVRAPARVVRFVSVQRFTPRGMFFRMRLR